MTEVQKEEERVKAKQYAEMMNVPYVDPFPEQQPNPNNPPAPELSDEELIARLNKRTGATITSLDDLKPKPTAEEIAAQQKEREANMLTYGLTSGKFNKDDYDAYQQANANKIAVVRSEVAEQFKAAFPELAPDAIEEKVANYFFEHLDPTDVVRQAREKELATLADMRIKDKYKNIVNLPTDFAQYEEGVNNKVNFERRVQATLPVYTADVNRALQSLKTFTIEIPDTKNPANSVNVELEYADNDLKEVGDLFLTTEQINRAVKDGLSFEQIKGEAELVLVKKHLPRLISQAAKKYNATQKESYLHGRKGFVNLTDHIEVSNEELKGTVDQQLDELIANAPVK